MALRWTVVAVALGFVAAGCGSADRSSANGVPEHPKYRTCGSAGSYAKPPVPVIERAWRDDQHFYVHVRMAAEPDECKPDRVRVAIVSSVQSHPMRALPADGNIYATLVDGRGEIVFELLGVDLPPYVALARSYTEEGAMSAELARRAIPETGDYCARHRPAERCIIEAEALAVRCVRGVAPRDRCPARLYGSRPLRPSIPVEGASFEAVVKHVREVLRDGTQDDIRLDAFTCSRELVCVATFSRDPSEGILRIRYYVSGSRGQPGCWYSHEHDIVEPPFDTARSPLAPYVPLTNRSSCLNWRSP